MQEFPAFIADNESISQLRRQIQKKWAKEEYWSFYVVRPISIYISLFITNKTKLSPNALTIIGIAFGLLSAAFFMLGSPAAVLIGCAFYQASYLIDCLDGEVARIVKKTSNFGIWLDIGLNYAQALSFLGIVYGLLKESPAAAAALYVAFFSILATIQASDSASLVFGQHISQVTYDFRKKSRWRDFIIFLFFSDTGLQLGLIILGTIWLVFGLKQLILAWVWFFLSVNLIKSLYKINLNIRLLKRDEEMKPDESRTDGSRIRD